MTGFRRRYFPRLNNRESRERKERGARKRSKERGVVPGEGLNPSTLTPRTV